MSENQQTSVVEALSGLMAQVRDAAWLGKAKRNPGLARMWLGQAHKILASIYGTGSEVVANFPLLPTPVPVDAVTPALEAGSGAVDTVLRALSVPMNAKASLGPPIVFIGHGGSPVWLQVKEFLTTRLRLQCEEFNSTVAAGIPTSVRLTQMLEKAAFAFLVMTPEDEHRDATRHARENVVHEVGLFQGRLGIARAIVLFEEGCEEFSNIHGLGQIRFPPRHIGAAFEDMRRVLEREGIIQPAGESPKTAESRTALSTYARNLLAAAADGDGSLMDYSTIQGRFIQANATSYGGPSNPRATAKWVAGLEQLVDEGMVQVTGEGMYQVTDLGYRTADSF